MNLQTNLNSTRYGQFLVPVPPPSDQERIVDFLEHETSQLARAAFAAQREITLLREYRTRLIADVVTGKLDVREAASRLPDEAEEAESFDDLEAVVEREKDVGDASLGVSEEVVTAGSGIGLPRDR